MLDRTKGLGHVKWLLRHFPVVALVGPRQVGKTTLAHMLGEGSRKTVHHFDLESSADLARLHDPLLALEPLRGLVVLDGVQRRPELFPALRVLADRPRRPARYLVLGSASPALLEQRSETLAGRIAYHELGPLWLGDVGDARLARLWRRGGFPRSFLAPSEAASEVWRRELVRTFLERDIPQLGVRIPARTLERFWAMLAHYHGQLWNSSELARAFGVADTTVRGYLDLLSATFMVRTLRPWFENLGKRQVKAPKVYLTDSGILHTLLGIDDQLALERHPKVGASWEGFALAQVVVQLNARPDECFFWATHHNAELDLLVVRGGKKFGFEFKRTAAPATTKSMHVALEDLKLESLTVIHAGRDTFALTPEIRAVALQHLSRELAPLAGGSGGRDRSLVRTNAR